MSFARPFGRDARGGLELPALGRRRGAFAPLDLYTGGTTDTGWFYDPNDMETMFQDAAGTTPAAIGSPVGLMLDKSQGLGLGPELVTNGTFDSDISGWGTATFVWDSGTAVASATNPSISQSNLTFAAGRTYEVKITTSNVVGGSMWVRLTGGGSPVNSPAFSNGSFIFRITSTGNTNLLIERSSGTVTSATIDNISVRELPGNHRRQTVALNRPTLLQDENGLNYLAYNGTSTSLSTSAFAWGTDKATVVAGVRKLSDAAGDRVIVEASANSGSTNGTFRLGTNAATFTWRSRGTVSADTSGAGAQPISAVLTGIGDISGDVARLRRNGAQVGEALTDQGTGNFGTHQAFFGARAGTSLFFNGREYSQFAINRLLTADELAQLKRYTAQRTGVTL